MTVLPAQSMPDRRCHGRRLLPFLPWLLAPSLGLLAGWLWRPERLQTAAPSAAVMATSVTPLPLERSLGATAGSQPLLAATVRQAEPLHDDLEPTSVPWPLDGALALGDTISRDSALEPPVPAMVRAERLLQQRSGDPLSTLPSALRPPFRRVLAQLPQHPGVRPARVVVLPVARLQHPIEVPLLLHPSGEIDVFATPMAPVAAVAMEHWLNRLDAPPASEVQPLLLRLMPMPAPES